MVQPLFLSFVIRPAAPRGATVIARVNCAGRRRRPSQPWVTDGNTGRSSPSPANTPARRRDRNGPRMSRVSLHTQRDRGVMRPRLAAVLRVTLRLGRRQAGAANPGRRGWLCHATCPGLLSVARCAGCRTGIRISFTALRFRRVLQRIQLFLPLFGLVRLVGSLIELHKVRHGGLELFLVFGRTTSGLTLDICFMLAGATARLRSTRLAALGCWPAESWL